VTANGNGSNAIVRNQPAAAERETPQSISLRRQASQSGVGDLAALVKTHKRWLDSSSYSSSNSPSHQRVGDGINDGRKIKPLPGRRDTVTSAIQCPANEAATAGWIIMKN